MKMDDADFEDLFRGGDLLEDSSQESLTAAAAHLTCDRDDMLLGESEEDSTCTFTATTKCIGENDGHVPAAIGRPAPSIPTADVTSTNKPSTSSSADAVPSGLNTIDKIEHVFEQIAKALLNDKEELSVTLKQRTPVGDGSLLQRTAAERWADAKSKRVCFPGKTADEAWRFTVVIRILELVHDALRSEVTLSKRDIYYRDPALFGSQSYVDRYVDDIAFTFGVPRSALNITAVAKGLVAGAFSFCRRDGSIVDARADRDGMLVPNLRDMICVDMKAVRWILVIEKEASFRSIASSAFWEMVESDGVVITGKGYPDIATRALLRYMSVPSPRNGFLSPPVYGLMDFDPDGLAILSVYKHGSNALAHENADLVVPHIKHLGLHSRHVSVGIKDKGASQGLLVLTARDRRKASRMLEREHDENVIVELQRMLMLGIKAELQLLDAVPNGMRDVLDTELGSSA